MPQNPFVFLSTYGRPDKTQPQTPHATVDCGFISARVEANKKLPLFGSLLIPGLMAPELPVLSRAGRKSQDT